ncbi:hypothetical protein FRC07_010831 [Ceratobasidium sp. 392]|nr:hypothetical protein FRC07_010831 [Ceratobasidium sp. 392]
MGQVVSYVAARMPVFALPIPLLSRGPVAPVVALAIVVEENVGNEPIQMILPEDGENVSPLLKSFRGIGRLELAE